MVEVLYILSTAQEVHTLGGWWLVVGEPLNRPLGGQAFHLPGLINQCPSMDDVLCIVLLDCGHL